MLKVADPVGTLAFGGLNDGDVKFHYTKLYEKLLQSEKEKSALLQKMLDEMRKGS